MNAAFCKKKKRKKKVQPMFRMNSVFHWLTCVSKQVDRPCSRTHLPALPAHLHQYPALVPLRLMSWWTLTLTQPTWPCPASRARKRSTHGDIAFLRRSSNLSLWSRRLAKCWCLRSRRYYLWPSCVYTVGSQTTLKVFKKFFKLKINFKVVEFVPSWLI